MWHHVFLESLNLGTTLKISAKNSIFSVDIMCGIAGIYNRNRINQDRSIIEKMSSAISHRGPDEEGFHFDSHAHIASRRLSIIDVGAGPQPVYNRDKTLCIAFNGEIYNYRSLRKELSSLGYCFQTKTDTEVVLAAYSLWGEHFLSRLNGMFAICLWDSSKKELFLARDRFGIKPLYMFELSDGTLLFASEIKALLQHPEITKKIHPRAIHNLLTYGFNIAPHTFFKEIKQVLPGHFVKAAPEGFLIKEYWDIDLESPIIDAGEEELACMLRQKLEHSVKSSLMSDVPVAAYLSGGIDSSAVTGIYSNLSDEKIKTITITFDDAGYDESGYSKKVSNLFNTENLEFKCAIEPDDIQNLIYHLENPLASLLNLPLFLLSRSARESGVKVVLTGDGADEVLGGYDYFKLLKAMSFIDRTEGSCRKNILRKIYPNLHSVQEAEAQFVYLNNIRSKFPVSHPAIPYQFSEFQLKEQLYSEDFINLLQDTPQDNPFFFNTEKFSHRPLVDQALYMDIKLRLLNLTLPLSDKMSMANSVEVRPLFLDHDFVNFTFRIPHHYKIQGLSEKQILKKSMADLLPGEICRRRKQPLQPPGKWFIDNAGEMLRYYLSDEKTGDAGYFNPCFVNYILAEYDADSKIDFSGVIIVVFFIQLWHDIFLNPH